MMFYGIEVDSRRTKSERETKDHLEKNRSVREREKQGRVEALERSQGSSAGQRVLAWKVSALCAYWRGETWWRDIEQNFSEWQLPDF